MYKFLSAALAAMLIFVSVFFAYEKWDHGKTRKRLNNEVAHLQGMQKEAETVFSRLAIESEDLRSNNKKLNDIISDRSEEILALSEINIQLKDQLLQIDSATESIHSVETITVTEECQEEIKDIRHRVDFSEKTDLLRVSGFTLTNPAYAEVKLEWIRAMKLEIILTKDSEDHYRVYIDSKKSDIIPTELKLQVDPSILDLDWYAKIGIGGDISASKTGIQASMRLFVNITPGLYIGPNFVVQHNGQVVRKFYGVSIGWNPWR